MSSRPAAMEENIAMSKVQAFEQAYIKKKMPDFRPGDTVRVHVRVVEGDRERIQVYQGMILKRQGSGVRETFTVRKVSFGVGVERTFLVHSPMLAKLEVKAHGDVRRAKLYYLRKRVGKKARVREKMRAGGLGESEAMEAAAEESVVKPEEAAEAAAVEAGHEAVEAAAEKDEALAEEVAEEVEEAIEEEAAKAKEKTEGSATE